jgi:hypothetical protein
MKFCGVMSLQESQECDEELRFLEANGFSALSTAAIIDDSIWLQGSSRPKFRVWTFYQPSHLVEEAGREGSYLPRTFIRFGSKGIAEERFIALLVKALNLNFITGLYLICLSFILGLDYSYFGSYLCFYFLSFYF